MSKDLSIDIETLGVNSDAPVLSVGWCWFNYDEPLTLPYDKRDMQFDLNEQCRHYGRVIDPETVKWWMKQSDEARNALFAEKPYALRALIPQLEGVLHAADTVWAKGPDFDCVILKSLCDAYAKVERAPVVKWPFWKHRCVRTFVGQFPTLAAMPFDGARHNALDDAVYQANQIRNIAGVLGHGN